MKKSAWLAAGAGLLAAGTVAWGQAGTGGTITDGDVIFTQGASPTGTAGANGTGPLADMKVAGATGADHVFENWWWFRVEGLDTREFALSDATSAVWSGNTGTLTYTYPTFSAVLTYVVTDTGTNAGQVVTSLAVTNTSGAPLTLQLFNYQDFDLQPNLGDDTATLVSANSIRVRDAARTNQARFIGAGATAYQVAAYPNVVNLLANTSVTNLDNSGLPFGPADFTAAMQWTVTLDTGASQTVSATIAVEPHPALGRCCMDVNCSIMTQDDCVAAGGTYGGDGSVCPDATYTMTTCTTGFEDISGTGANGPACDDCGTTVPLGFSFNFFGHTYTTVGVASNGYLTFGTTLGDFSNDAIPNVAAPNDIIAGFWDDLNTTGVPVKTLTMGPPGNQQFIAQWTNVPHFNAPTLLHTFQIVLFEGSNNIELRYQTLPALSATVTPSIGVENSTGTVGFAVDPATVVPPTCIGFNFVLPENPCRPTPVCPCDWNQSGSLNSQDFFDFLGSFFNSTGDFNHDGTTNSQDFFDFLGCFFTPPAGCA